VATLGSRAQLCVHPQVAQKPGASLNAACRSLVSKRRCKFHDAVESKKETFRSAILDIEELVQAGKDEEVCPYYMSRELEATADLVLMPYNYLLDPSIRRQMKMNLADCVVILDEAHNVENICADASSFELEAVTITNCVRDLDRCLSYVEMVGGNANVTADELLLLKRRVLNLEAAIARRISEPGERGERVSPSIEGVTYPGADIRALFGDEGLDISPDTFEAHIELFERVINLLTEESDSSGRAATAAASSTALHDLVNAVHIAFRGAGSGAPGMQQDATQFYRVHVSPGKAQPDTAMRRGTAAAGPTLNFWCFNPGLAMEDIAAYGVRSIIVTSGTLAPLASFAAELATTFHVRLENPHVIDREQLFVGVLRSGPDGVTSLDSSFKNRSTEAYRRALGQTVLNFARVVPRGMLCFFSSYSAKDECFTNWLQSGTMAALRKAKEVCSEERGGAAQFAAEIDRFYANARTRGALFFGVCRGKASEGIDFADHNGRAVVLTGLPFANRNSDAKVLLKIRFMDEIAAMRRRANAPADSILGGDEWYRQQAVRAVNQAIGRVIRHRNDWGAILLCDPRFGSDSVRNQLSRWLRPHVKVFDKFADCQQQLVGFLRSRPPEPDVLPEAKPTAAAAVVAQPGDVARPGAVNKRRLLPPQGQIDPAAKRSASIAAAHSLVGSLRSTTPSAATTTTTTSAATSLAGQLSRGGGAAAASTAPPPPSSSSNASQGSSAQQYLDLVRQTIGDEYATFRTILHTYRASGELEPLIMSVRALFSTAERVHLLRGFSQFLKAGPLRERYESAIASDVQTAIFGEPLRSRAAQVQPIDRRSFDLVLGRTVRPVVVQRPVVNDDTNKHDDDAGDDM
jgi:regulator of telomere elongation helicase 1